MRLGSQSDEAAWSPWKARLGLSYIDVDADQADRTLASSYAPASLKLGGVQLFGDYYFSPASGFRATGGLMRGSTTSAWVPDASDPGANPGGMRGPAVRGTADAAPSTASLLASSPTSAYLGAGYSYKLQQAWGGDWSFNADLGLMTSSPGSMTKLGKVFTGTQGLDDLFHDLHLRPVLQIGVSYSF